MDSDSFLIKYKPKLLDDIVGNSYSIQRLKSMIKNNNIHDLIISGNSGIGKSSAIECFINEYYGEEIDKKHVLELNASEDRGINIIRGKVLNFAKEKNNSEFKKFIIFEDIETITENSQQSLRQIIETYDKCCFIFIANDSESLIESIHSRCIHIHFSKLNDKDIEKKINMISKKEKIQITANGIKTLIFISNSDLRQAIINLMCISYGFDKITEENIYKISDKPHPNKMSDIFRLLQKNKLNESLSEINELINIGYSLIDIINILYKTLLETSFIIDFKKINIVKHISKCHLSILNGVENKLQIFYLLIKIKNILVHD